MGATQIIKNTELQVGDVVHAYGARFRIVEVKTYREADGYFMHPWSGDTTVGVGEWIDGCVKPGYFGPKKNFKFQGNSSAHRCIESRA